jgi:hypothetical protein
MRSIWSRSWGFSKIITIIRAQMRLWTVTGPLKSAVTESRNLLRYTATLGKSIAAGCSNFRLPPELQFAMHIFATGGNLGREPYLVNVRKQLPVQPIDATRRSYNRNKSVLT